VVAHHQALQEQRSVGTSVCETTTLQVTHVVQLPTVQTTSVLVSTGV
jgi:hypothetical protein